MMKVSNVSLSKGRTYYQKENYYSKESEKEFSCWQADRRLFGLARRVLRKCLDDSNACRRRNFRYRFYLATRPI